MAGIKYTCGNCNHTFIGDDFTTECEKCQSEQLKVISSGAEIPNLYGLLDSIKKYKFPISIFIVLILILFFSRFITKETSTGYFIESIKQVDNYLEVNVLKVSVDSEGRPVNGNNYENKKTVFNGDLNDIIIGASIVNFGKVKILDKNRIYLCKENEGPISLKFDFKNSKLKSITKSANFKLIGEASEKAGCQNLPISSTEISVKEIANCKLKVTVSRNLKGVPLMVSVTGKNGPYESKEIWDRNGLSKQNIFVYIQGQDTSMAVGSQGNGSIISSAGCVNCDSKSLSPQFNTIVNNYLKDPSDRDFQKPFQNFIITKFTDVQIKLNGQLINDLSTFQNIIRVNFLNNGRKYEIDGIPEITPNCVLKFKVIEH
jgi:hypothetical protein